MKKMFFFLAILGICISCGSKVYPDANWGNDKKWVVAEIRGVPVQTSGTDKDAHLVFMPADKRYAGTGGCNRISGTYSLEKKDRITFSSPAVTRMACPDLAFESSFLNTLASVDRFSIENGILLLRKGDEIVIKLK